MLDESFINIAKTQILANIAAAKGGPCKTKEANAYAIIDMFDSSEGSNLKKIYSKVTSEQKEVDVAELVSLLDGASNSEKAELLRGCCYIAMCDGKLSAKEHEVISQVGSLLGFSDQDIELAMKSVG